MNILRVFPHKTSYTPIDNMVRFGLQTLGLPQHDEIHISCTFTWDMDYSEYLQEQYQAITDKPVLLGGVAYESPVGEHIQGLYTKLGVTFTSRGCNNKCSFCFVPRIEGALVELEVKPGNIIQDNNFLQCSREHKEKVFDMLQTQRAIEFKGGIETRLVDDWFAYKLGELQKQHRLKSIWVACDHDAAIKPLEEAMRIFRDNNFNAGHNNTYCYCLCYGDDRASEEKRMEEVYRLGVMPFAQLYRKPERTKTIYDKDTERWARSWSRPAAIKAHMEKGTTYANFGI